MRVRCPIHTAQIALFGGQHEGVSMRLDALPPDSLIEFPEGGEIVFPMRRGDRRIFEWLGAELGYKSTASTFFIISASWMPWDEGPTIYAR